MCGPGLAAPSRPAPPPSPPRSRARPPRVSTKKPQTRAKYTPSEQAYVDRKINDALTHFGVPIALGPSADEPEAATIQADIPINKDTEAMNLDELLLALLGENRRGG